MVWVPGFEKMPVGMHVQVFLVTWIIGAWCGESGVGRGSGVIAVVVAVLSISSSAGAVVCGVFFCCCCCCFGFAGGVGLDRLMMASYRGASHICRLGIVVVGWLANIMIDMFV